MRLLRHARHRRKLRRGAHRGNHFRVRLRNVAGAADARLRTLAARGVPNYFGEQRFGRGGGNVDLALGLAAGERLGRQARSYALSAARALLFNAILEARVADGSWNRLLADDIIALEGSGSVFPAPAPDAALRRRAAALDLHPSGALWGRGAGDCGAQLAARERAAVHPYAALAEAVTARCDVARRALRLVVHDLAWEAEGDALVLDFVLGRGAFATAVLREVADYRDRSR